MADLIEIYNRLVPALRGENDAVTREFFHDDFKFYEDPGMPYGGDYEGAESFIHVRRKVKEYWTLEIESKCASPEGDRLVIVLKLTGLPDGPVAGLETWVCVVWRFRGEKASEARILYFDTPTMGAPIRAALAVPG